VGKANHTVEGIVSYRIVSYWLWQNLEVEHLQDEMREPEFE
jgi:hypothetical protein